MPSSFETHRFRDASQDEVLDPHGEERVHARLDHEATAGVRIIRTGRKMLKLSRLVSARQ